MQEAARLSSLYCKILLFLKVTVKVATLKWEERRGRMTSS